MFIYLYIYIKYSLYIFAMSLIISIFVYNKNEKYNTFMENKIVLFSNIKGGVGKTTLCALFASYLAGKGVPVIAIDADLQASLYRHRQREAKVDPEYNAPWSVELLNTSDETSLTKVLENVVKVPGIVLIDCPGNLNDKNLAMIYNKADAAVIPMSYDADTVDATGLFVKAFKTISHAKLVFAPNRINALEGKAEDLRQRSQTVEVLELLGTVLPRVKQSVAVKRYTTLYPLDLHQRKAVEAAFDQLITEINI